jgi:hypothetical protein
MSSKKNAAVKTVKATVVVTPAAEPVRKMGRPSGSKNRIYGVPLGKLNEIFKGDMIIPIPRSIAVSFFGADLGNFAVTDLAAVKSGPPEAAVAVRVSEPAAVVAVDSATSGL